MVAVRPSSRTASRTANPSMNGIMTSRMIASGDRRAVVATPLEPSSARSTSWPSFSRMRSEVAPRSHGHLRSRVSGLAVRTASWNIDLCPTGDRFGDRLLGIHPHVAIDDGRSHPRKRRRGGGSVEVPANDVVLSSVRLVVEPAVRGAVGHDLTHPTVRIVPCECEHGKVAV